MLRYHAQPCLHEWPCQQQQEEWECTSFHRLQHNTQLTFQAAVVVRVARAGRAGLVEATAGWGQS